MTKNRIALLGSALLGAALICGVPVKAQEYGPYTRYDDSAGETVIVHPDYDFVEKRQLIGHINGEVNPEELSISRPVSFSDLDLSREADYIQLRERVRSTARDLCAELDDRFAQLRGDRSADQECVRNATRNAMRDVMERAS